MRRGAIAVAALLLVASAATAADPKRGWDDLTPEQREEVWRNFREYQELPPERRQFLDRRYDKYRDLSPAERRRLRKNYDRYRDLPPGERRRFNQQYREWKSRSGPKPRNDQSQPRSGGKKKKKR